MLKTHLLVFIQLTDLVFVWESWKHQVIFLYVILNRNQDAYHVQDINNLNTLLTQTENFKIFFKHVYEYSHEKLVDVQILKFDLNDKSKLQRQRREITDTMLVYPDMYESHFRQIQSLVVSLSDRDKTRENQMKFNAFIRSIYTPIDTIFPGLYFLHVSWFPWYRIAAHN